MAYSPCCYLPMFNKRGYRQRCQRYS